MPNLPKAALAAGLVLAALCLGACDGSGEPGEALPATGAPEPSDAPTPTAADGTNVAACADGNCELAVSGPVDIPVKEHGAITTLSVTTVDASGLSFTTKSANGTSSGDLHLGCRLTFYRGGGGTSCGVEDPPEPVTGVLAMQVASVTDGTAVLRLVSGAVGRPPTSLVPVPPAIPHFPR